MSLKERALRAAAMKAVSDALKAEVDSERSELMSELLDMYHDFGAKSFDVHLDGVKVASIPLSIPKPGPGGGGSGGLRCMDRSDLSPGDSVHAGVENDKPRVQRATPRADHVH